MAKKILGVVRASTDRQDTTAQKKELEEFILSKGFTEDEIEWLEAHLSSTQRLDVYKQFLDEIKLKCSELGIKNIAVWHLNRIGRKEKFLIDLKEYLIENKIQLYVREPNLTLLNDDGTESQGGSMLYSLFTQIIAGDNRERAEKFKRGKNYAQKEKGQYIGGRVMYGYKLDETKRFIVEPEEAEVIKRIYALYNSRQQSCYTISDILKSEGVLKRGKRFTKDFVNDILNNEQYCGIESERGNNVYPPIITESEYRTARSIMEGNRCVKGRESKHAFLGNALIVCDKCGYKYTTNQDRIYMCTLKKQYKRFGYDKPCDSPSVNMELLDHLLWNISRSLHFDKLMNRNEEEIKKNEEEITRLKKQIEGKETEMTGLSDRRNRLENDYYLNKLSENRYNELLKLIDAENNRLKNDISFLEDSVRVLEFAVEQSKLSSRDAYKIMEEVNRLIPSNDNDKKIFRKIVRGYVKEIRVKKDDKFTVVSIRLMDDRILNMKYSLKTNSGISYIGSWLNMEGYDEWLPYCIVRPDHSKEWIEESLKLIHQSVGGMKILYDSIENKCNEMCKM